MLFVQLIKILNMKNKLVVSFSGGETSAYMAYWINKNWSDMYDIVYVFANTGEESEETLRFINKCESYFNIKINWVEAVINDYGQKVTHKEVCFKSASRNGEPFENLIRKLGIPNTSYNFCSRDLKLSPINDFVKNKLKWSNYYTAIGIRIDEIDRVRLKRKELKLLYPLVTDKKMTKRHINFWWSQQEFRLNLKSWEGNCKTCWKKSFKKLATISLERPSWFNNFKKWESEFENFYPETQNRPKDKKIRFFREEKSVKDIFDYAKNLKKNLRDENKEISFQEMIDFDDTESCDIHSECGA